MPIVIPTPTNLLEQVEKRVSIACSQAFSKLTQLEIVNLITRMITSDEFIKKLMRIGGSDDDPQNTYLITVDAEDTMPKEQLNSLPDYLFKTLADLDCDFFPFFIAKGSIQKVN